MSRKPDAHKEEEKEASRSKGPSIRHALNSGQIAGLYDLLETIGRGHFATVKLARHVFTGEKVAVKVIDKTKLDEAAKAHLFQEVRCMKLVQHPNVVRLYEVIDTHTKLFLVLELADGGDLYEYITRYHKAGLPEESAREYFAQIVHAIRYCHQLRVVHRDLKPENVVFFEKLRAVKLTDFGFSNSFRPGEKLATSCGSLAYSAPEILLGDSYHAPAVDVWSLGVILFMLVTGRAPFSEANDSETLTMILDCNYQLPNHVSKECKQLIQTMLVRDPEKRATLDEVIEHPWVMAAQTCDLSLLHPLVTREHLTENEHELIVAKMVKGEIAEREEILEALENDRYNYMTATYYLLAERYLKLKREKQLQQSMLTEGDERRSQEASCKESQIAANASTRPSPAAAAIAASRNLEPLALSPRAEQNDPDKSSFQFKENATLNLLVSPLASNPSFTGSNVSSRRSSVSDADAELESDHDLNEAALQNALEMNQRKKAAANAGLFRQQVMAKRTLHTAKSSPQLLNQICEEESDDDHDDQHAVPSSLYHSVRLSRHGRHTIASPEKVRKHLHRFRKTPHAPSCSSSDASDTDDTSESRKRTDRLNLVFHRHRRPSSSDSDREEGGNFGSERRRDNGGDRASGQRNCDKDGSTKGEGGNYGSQRSPVAPNECQSFSTRAYHQQGRWSDPTLSSYMRTSLYLGLRSRTLGRSGSSKYSLCDDVIEEECSASAKCHHVSPSDDPTQPLLSDIQLALKSLRRLFIEGCSCSHSDFLKSRQLKCLKFLKKLAHHLYVHDREHSKLNLQDPSSTAPPPDSEKLHHYTTIIESCCTSV